MLEAGQSPLAGQLFLVEVESLQAVASSLAVASL
jgi:hypothetical protein